MRHAVAVLAGDQGEGGSVQHRQRVTLNDHSGTVLLDRRLVGHAVPVPKRTPKPPLRWNAANHGQVGSCRTSP